MFCIVHGSDPSHILDDWNEGQLTVFIMSADT